MGHLLSTKSSLVPLIDRLNRYPIGLVDNAKLREILALLFDEREAFVASRFPLMEATLEELCDYCGECLRACNVKCVGLSADARADRSDGSRPKRFAEVRSDICLGCGVCIPTCERGAISLVKRRGYRKPPRNAINLFGRILWEKGRLMPFLKEGLKRRWHLPPLRRE
jgi:ferredoxin